VACEPDLATGVAADLEGAQGDDLDVDVADAAGAAAQPLQAAHELALSLVGLGSKGVEQRLHAAGDGAQVVHRLGERPGGVLAQKLAELLEQMLGALVIYGHDWGENDTAGA